MTRIAIIAGSTRPGRRSLTVAHWVHEAASRRTAPSSTSSTWSSTTCPTSTSPSPPP